MNADAAETEFCFIATCKQETSENVKCIHALCFKKALVNFD